MLYELLHAALGHRGRGSQLKILQAAIRRIKELMEVHVVINP